MKVVLNIFAGSQDGNHFADIEVDGLIGCLPRIGDTVSIESFFPEFLSADWEQGDLIQPFGVVKDVVFYKDKIEVDLKA